MGLAQNALTTVAAVVSELNLALPGLVVPWTPSTAFALGTFVEPPRPNGRYYKATAATGNTGVSQPVWPFITGGTVNDGNITWTDQGPSQQGQVEQVINAASEGIERYCNRKFLYGQWTENIGATGRNYLAVKRTPLRSLVSVSFQGALLPSTGDYAIYEQQVDGTGALIPSESGLIYRQVGWTNTAPFYLAAQPFQRPGDEFDIYQVVYVGGYQTPQFDGLPGVGGALVAPAINADLPAELEQACVKTAVSIFRRNGWDRNVLSESFADARVQYRDNAELIPAEVKPVLNRYRRPV